MTIPASFLTWIAELKRLHAPDVLGRYSAYEVTEVIGIPTKGAVPINVLSVIVAEDNEPLVPFAPGKVMLTPKLVSLPGLKDWRFGLVRYALPPADLVATLLRYATAKIWHPSGTSLEIGDLEPLPRSFAPADGAMAQSLNKILKNNFEGGSHLFELADPTKASLAALLEHPPRLQALSERLSAFCPFELARASDRLGNVLIQLPVTVLQAALQVDRSSSSMSLEVAWRPGCAARALRLHVERRFDGIVPAAWSGPIGAGVTALPIADTAGEEAATLWDDLHGVALWAQPPLSRVRQITAKFHITRPERRHFRHAPDERNQEVRVADGDDAVIVGRPVRLDQETWTQRRLYDAERTRLARERRFVQYTPTLPASDGHEAALADIRSLIAAFGEEAVWLWDPYLSAEDILKTLFHCPHAEADLRGLSDAMSVPEPPRPNPRRWAHSFWTCLQPPKPQSRPSFADAQRARLTACAGNLEGLKLEYRARVGQTGWSFHDRFLIFPMTHQGPLAWSLGTSVNMLGHKHHILQRVDDGRLVADAFEELWDKLTSPEQLIWKTP